MRYDGLLGLEVQEVKVMAFANDGIILSVEKCLEEANNIFKEVMLSFQQ